MDYILGQNIVEIVCDCIKINEPRYIAVALEALSNLLEFGKKYYVDNNGKNLIVKKIEQLGMFDVLEQLQYHPVEIVYEKTLKILEAYFDTENQN
jgi:hypothetical protein